jgi:hypothetical protein
MEDKMAVLKSLTFTSLPAIGAIAGNRVVDVLREFSTHRLTDFVIAFAHKITSGGKAVKIGHRYKIPNDQMGWHG